MKIAEYAAEVERGIADTWLGSIYRDRVLKIRTRAYQFPPIKQNAAVSIQHTLLGVELKVGKQRLWCPDLATARYLSVFARIGCEAVAVPYDITKVSRLADELESSWHRMLLLIEHNAATRSATLRARIKALLVAKLKAEVAAAGAGPVAPSFTKTTRQRVR